MCNYVPGATQGLPTALRAGGERASTIFLSRAGPLLADAPPRGGMVRAWTKVQSEGDPSSPGSGGGMTEEEKGRNG